MMLRVFVFYRKGSDLIFFLFCSVGGTAETTIVPADAQQYYYNALFVDVNNLIGVIGHAVII